MQTDLFNILTLMIFVFFAMKKLGLIITQYLDRSMVPFVHVATVAQFDLFVLMRSRQSCSFFYVRRA